MAVKPQQLLEKHFQKKLEITKFLETLIDDILIAYCDDILTGNPVSISWNLLKEKTEKEFPLFSWYNIEDKILKSYQKYWDIKFAKSEDKISDYIVFSVKSLPEKKESDLCNIVLED